MYHISGYTNYDCSAQDESSIGEEYTTLEEALRAFLRYSAGQTALDFSYIDNQLREWRAVEGWEEDFDELELFQGRMTLVSDEDYRVIVSVCMNRDPQTFRNVNICFDREESTPEEWQLFVDIHARMIEAGVELTDMGITE